jgi:hypothetical protein
LKLAEEGRRKIIIFVILGFAVLLVPLAAVVLSGRLESRIQGPITRQYTREQGDFQ